MNKGIYKRGYLPHWDFKASLQAITFRLADSVPASAIDAWKRELATEPDDSIRQKELHRRIARYEDAGHGCSVLRQPECAATLQDRLITGHPGHYKLIEWCIMPNHVHVLVKLAGDSSLSKIIQSWKGASSCDINRILGQTGPLWQRDYHDRFVRDMDHYHDCRAYIRNNPVKAGLCTKPEDWPFSSAGAGWDGAPASAGQNESTQEQAG